MGLLRTNMDEDGFVRQRRNLILASLLLIFTQGTGLTLTELNVLGNKAELQRYLAVEPILWLAWFYLSLRYWQAFKESGKPTFTAYATGELNRLLLNYVAKRIGSSKVPKEVFPITDFLGNPSVTINQVKPRGWFSAPIQLRFLYQAPGTPPREVEADWNLGPSVILPYRVLAAFTTTLNSSTFTELYLPFLIGIMPIIHLIVRKQYG